MVNYIMSVLVEGQKIELEQWYVKKSELLRSLIEEIFYAGITDNSETIALDNVSTRLFKITQDFQKFLHDLESHRKGTLNWTIEIATGFCQKYDEDTLVELYQAANYLGLNDLYK